MNRKLLIALLVSLALSASRPLAAADSASFGIGFGIGEASYISVKYRMFALGAGWSAFNSLHIHGDYWFINDPVGSEGLKWFLGAGVKLRLFGSGKGSWNAPFAFGVRVPVGLQYFIKPDVELFGEVAPGLAIFFPFGPWGDGVIGIRFYI